MKIKLYFAFLLLTSLSRFLAQELDIYAVNMYEPNTVSRFGAFISVSDHHSLSDHPDSLAIPTIDDADKNSVETIELDKTYRKRFLTQTGISESDYVFIYDYAADVEFAFKVRDLEVIASLNIYASDDDWPYSQYDYQFGFAIPNILLKGITDHIYYNTLVAIGKKSPFARGGMTPMVWKKIDSKEFDSLGVQTSADTIISEYGYTNYTTGEVHSYEIDGFQYFALDIIDAEQNVFGRHLVVLKSGTKEMVCDKVYLDGEGSRHTPLNGMGEGGERWDGDDRIQWTGKLFKNKPTVVFGFEYTSFGCPCFSFLDLKEADLEINCDNRH